MGLIGILIATFLILFGAGYDFFDAPSSPTTITNEASLPKMTEELARFEEVKKEALELKEKVEEKAVEAMKAAEEPEHAVAPSASPPPAPELKESESQEPDQKKQDGLKIENRLMGSGFAVPKNPRIIDTVVLHSSYDPAGNDPYSEASIIKIYEGYGVSAHYLIGRSGIVYRLVEEKNIAYHAGVSKMPDGRRNANDFSIGIEIMNTEKGQMTGAQYDAVNDLIASLKKKYPIKTIVGHGDIAPGRKTDPWNFDWKKLK